jgi:hypothetical protein
MDMSVQKFLKRREIAEASRKFARHFTTDGMMTYDQATVDSTGVFLIGQLERLDQTLNEPLVEFTWSRDVEIRTDVSPADEVASWTNSAFAMAGGINPGGLNWISNEGNALAGPSVDIGKTPQPMRLWGAEVKYTVPELVKAQALGQPVDAQKVEGMNLKRNMDLDNIVYFGDSTMGFTGLVNSNSAVGSFQNVANGAASTPQWTTKTALEILKDCNEILTSAWAASGWKVLPNRLLLPPAQLGYIGSQPVNTAAQETILSYIMKNNISTKSGHEAGNPPAEVADRRGCWWHAGYAWHGRPHGRLREGQEVCPVPDDGTPAHAARVPLALSNHDLLVAIRSDRVSLRCDGRLPRRDLSESRELLPVDFSRLITGA